MFDVVEGWGAYYWHSLPLVGCACLLGRASARLLVGWTLGLSDMGQPCVVCAGDGPKYEGSGWCCDCVADTLVVQAREAKEGTVRPQVFET